MKSVLRWIAGGLLAAGFFSGCRLLHTTGAPGSATVEAPEDGFMRLDGAEIFSARYDAEHAVLMVITRRGDVWRYENVPAAIADALRLSNQPDSCWREQVDAKYPRIEL